MHKKKEIFTIQEWNIDAEANAVSFNFECSLYGTFNEIISFPETANLKKFEKSEIFHNLLDVMAAYLGVSYYKLSAADDLKFKMSFSNDAKKSIEEIYTQGLGEFYIRNELQYPPSIKFDYGGESKISFGVSEEALRKINAKKVTVAFGGGKDSHVSVGLLDGLDVEQELVSVVLSDSVKETLLRLSEKEITFINRYIDSKLIDLVKDGRGYNGHIPITAINSIILTAYSFLTGNEWVVFSNERGASIPTMNYEGHAINHQYSKSFEFEKLFRNVVNDICGKNVQYFSLLRSFSELWIAAYLAKEVLSAHSCFSSCNKNFIFEGSGKLEEGKRWCGTCSKCVYTAIIIAPHVTRLEFLAIFGSDILNAENNIQIAKNLCGTGNSKPWECVGDFFDTASALFSLSSNDEWVDALIPKLLFKELESKYGSKFLNERFSLEMSLRGESFMPDMLSDLVNKSS